MAAMGVEANVRSLDAIRQFRATLIRALDDVSAALASVRQEIGRTLHWIDHDCPAHWQQRVRSGFDQLAEARTQLARRQLMTVAGRHPECIDEKRILRLAKQRLADAQEMIRIVRRWSIQAHRAADEHSSRVGKIEQQLHHDVPRMLALLERILATLESYAALRAPALPEIDGPPGQPAGAPSAATPAAAAGGSP
jgi:hypothetical protein